MAGLVVSSIVAGRLLSPEDPEPLALIALVAGLMVLGASAPAAGVREDPATAQAGRLRERLRLALHTDLKANSPYWHLIWGRLVFLLGVYGIQAFAQYYVRDTLHPENPLQLTGDLLATIVLSIIAFSHLQLPVRPDRTQYLHVAAIAVAIRERC
jgi:hypothetical protein